jgi:hypothetical protein
MGIAADIMGWMPLDEHALEGIIGEFELDPEDVADDAMLDRNDLDINRFIYSALYLGASKIKSRLKELFPEYSDEIDEYDENIYTNYLDSGFDSAFSEWSLDMLDDVETAAELLAEMLGLSDEEKEKAIKLAEENL